MVVTPITYGVSTNPPLPPAPETPESPGVADPSWPNLPGVVGPWEEGAPEPDLQFELSGYHPTDPTVL